MLEAIADYIKRMFNPPHFVVSISDSETLTSRGKVNRAFIDGCLNICRDYNIKSGKIYGVKCHHGVRLEFLHIPENHQQRFRNVWNAHARH